MTLSYRNAFTEVYEILNYLEDYEYNKIPKDVINVIEENRNKEHKYFLDESIPLEEQKMLPETRAILFNFFRDYFATKEQKEKIIAFQKRERIKAEEKKREEYKYLNDAFYRKNDREMIKQEKSTELIENKEKSIFKKIFRKIINLLKRR